MRIRALWDFGDVINGDGAVSSNEGTKSTGEWIQDPPYCCLIVNQSMIIKTNIIRCITLDVPEFVGIEL